MTQAQYETDNGSEPTADVALTLALSKLRRDVRAAGALIGRDEARFLVELYYATQDHRKALAGQERALNASEKPFDIIHHFANQMFTLEKQMVSVLDPFTMASEVGRWARAQVGIGPIISAGLLAHIDITRAPTVGHIWRFAGLDPTQKWEKGQKRPWNAALKLLCWKAGDSFVKVSGRDDAFYGHVYRQRKAQEVERNEAGAFADQAAETLERKRISDPATKARYESGCLPDGRIDLRARRYAVKLFLAHFHDVAYREHFGEAPPLPYAIAQLGHAHYVEPPAGK